VNTTALIIGAAAIGGLFIVWRAASQPAAPLAAPPAAPCQVSYAGAGVSCGTIKAAASAVKKGVVTAAKGISSVPGALLGTNKSVSLFAQATGQVGSGFGPNVRGVA
jgi:hypothetical protein